MKIAIAIAVCLLLSGCPGVPTFEYCQDISYVRHGNQVDVVATCALPIGGGLLPTLAK